MTGESEGYAASKRSADSDIGENSTKRQAGNDGNGVVDLTQEENRDDPAVEISEVRHLPQSDSLAHPSAARPRPRQTAQREKLRAYITTLPGNEKKVAIRLVKMLQDEKQSLFNRKTAASNDLADAKQQGNKFAEQAFHQLWLSHSRAQLDLSDMVEQICNGTVANLGEQERVAQQYIAASRQQDQHVRQRIMLQRSAQAQSEYGRYQLANDPVYQQGRANSYVSDQPPPQSGYQPSVSGGPQQPIRGMGTLNGNLAQALNQIQQPRMPTMPQNPARRPLSGVIPLPSPSEFRRNGNMMDNNAMLAAGSGIGSYGRPVSSIYDSHVNLQDYEELVDQARKDADPADMPKELKVDFWEHQRLGLGWLLRAEFSRNRGGILADDMGLGKTVQTIALMYANTPKTGRQKQTLIICPVALLENWRTELEKRVRPEFRYRVYIHHRATQANHHAKFYTEARDIQDQFDVVIATYSAVTAEYKNFKSHEGESPLFDIEWYRVVLDEAHTIKNRQSKGSLACAHLRSVYRLCLTGTPMQNDPAELYPLVRFLHIEPYWQDWSRFKKLVPSIDSPRSVQAEGRIALVALLSAIMLRRKKDTVINGKKILDTLPAKTQEDIYVRLEGEELEAYKTLEGTIQAQASRLMKLASENAYSNMLVLLLRLRQQACHPLLIEVTKRNRVRTTSFKDPKKEIRAAKRMDPSRRVQVLNEFKGTSGVGCSVCQDAMCVLPHETFALTECGHFCCHECANKFEEGLEDDDDEGQRCRIPDCNRPVTGWTCIEVLDAVGREQTRNDNLIVADLRMRHRIRQSDERSKADARKKALSQLIHQQECKDMWEQGFDSEEDADDNLDTKPKEVSSDTSKGLHNVLDINRVAELFYVPDVFLTGWVPSAKVDKCMEVLNNIWKKHPEDKVIVFSFFTSMLSLMTIPLEAGRVPFLEYNGALSAPERSDVLEKFRNTRARVLLTSVKAGNVGLTLTEANHVIIMDPYWNPYVEEQAKDRVYRIGQSKPVTIYRVLVEDSVENRIIDLQSKKMEVIEGCLDPEQKRRAQGLNRNDLLYALGLRR